MLSRLRLTSSATRAISWMASSVNSSSTSSVARSSVCCLSMFVSGSVRIRMKSFALNPLSSTRIGSRPCSSASMSDGLFEWKAPEHMNSMWSVSTFPYFVVTDDPSMMGSRSRCTPSLLASGEYRFSLLETILSISSMKTMPSDSTEAIASLVTDSLSTRRSNSSSSISGRASRTVIFFLLSFCLKCPRTNLFRAIVTSCAPTLSEGMLICVLCGTSISTERLSRVPCCRRERKALRVLSSAPSVPMTRSRSFSSTAALTFAAILRFILAFVCRIAFSTRSRTIWSTSRPWKPTSVNLVASTLTKGASAIFARRRAISVLPQPVGPIMRMFLGTTSAWRSSGMRCRRHRLRMATATARLASL
mmetsp:Transcript_36982/g.87858  ORF Transcript_36982/g.87858 Transcript_36982/m.87858 type:complete len:362 (-) Transcript_36982:431-1516(-)